MRSHRALSCRQANSLPRLRIRLRSEARSCPPAMGPETVQHDRGPRFCQRAGDAETDAAGRAGHERHLAREGRAWTCLSRDFSLDVHEAIPCLLSPTRCPGFEFAVDAGQKRKCLLASEIDTRRLLRFGRQLLWLAAGQFAACECTPGARLMEMHQVRYFLAVARTAELHARRRRVQRHPALAYAGDQAARGANSAAICSGANGRPRN